MKTWAFLLLSLALTGATAASLAAQCVFDPTVSGELLVCPEGSTTLSTQQYDSYQWYRRAFPSGVAEAIPGATGQTLSVDFLETPVYISVEATQAGCTEKSPEVLADGLAFLPVVVASEGSFEISPNGEQVICAGDTIFQIILQPYTINIQWYNGPEHIAGATNDTLVVTQPGNYWVTGSPEQCPGYTASLGLQIPVIWGATPGCATGTTEPAEPFDVTILPNPARTSVFVAADIPGGIRLTLFDAQGKTLREMDFEVAAEIITTDLPAGIYTMHLKSRVGRLTRQLVVN